MPPTAAQPDFAPARSTVFALPSLNSGGGGLQYSGSDDIQFPEDVQDEANSYFEKIYRLTNKPSDYIYTSILAKPAP